MNPTSPLPMKSALRSFRRLLLVVLATANGMFAAAQTTNAPANYSTFSKFISERNIFNPNRYARAANTPYRPRTRPVRRNSFALAGTMSYDEGENAGSHAFFDGTSGDYRKVVQTNGTIAIFTVVDITPESVTLVFETNTTLLKIGGHMRDDGRGHWSLSTEAFSYAVNSPDDSVRRRDSDQAGDTNLENTVDSPLDGMAPSDAVEEPGEPPSDVGEIVPTEPVPLPGGPGSEALRRLMELRAREEQQNGNRN